MKEEGRVHRPQTGSPCGGVRDLTMIEDLQAIVTGCQEVEARVSKDLQDLREGGAQEGCTRLSATKASLRVKEALTALAKSNLALALLEREVKDGGQWVDYLEGREAALWAHHAYQTKSREIWSKAK